MPSTHIYYQSNVDKAEDPLEEEYVSFFTSEENDPRDNLPATCDRRLQISCIVDPHPKVLCGGVLYANNHLTTVYMTKEFATHLDKNRRVWVKRHEDGTALTADSGPDSDGEGQGVQVEELKAYKRSLSGLTQNLGLTYPAEKALEAYLCGYPTLAESSGVSRIHIDLEKVPFPKDISAWESSAEIFNFGAT